MPEIRVPVFGRFVVADPDRKATRVEYRRLSEVLTQERHTDVFFTQYSNEDHPYRLSEATTACAPTLVLAVFDVDDKQKGHDKRARAEWLTRERAKISALIAATGVHVYETRGGYRIVSELPEPFVIRESTDAAAWTARYKTWCNYLLRAFDIKCDHDPQDNWLCTDWQRIFRVPHSTRDRGGEPERLPTYGPANDPGIWAPELAPEDFVEPEDTKRRLSESVDDMQHATPLGVRVAHALTAAETLPPAVSRSGGHNALLVAASTIYRGFALPREHALAILEDTYNPRCEPPWKLKELNHKLDAVERSNERWGEEIDAIMLAQALESWDPRPSPREPSDPEEEDEPVPSDARASDGTAKSPTAEPKEWANNGAQALEYFNDIGDPVPTGIETIDRITNGGLRRGEPSIFGGAPNTGKTGLTLTVAFKLSEQGHKVAVGAFDEPKSRLAVRMGQFLGFDRELLWKGGDAAAKAAMAKLPVKIYNGRAKDVTIEWIAEKLGEHGPGVMVIDSLQTARSKAHVPRMSEPERLQATCEAIDQLASKHKHLVLVTSEINRDYYRNHEQALQLSPMAAFSGTRAIEYTFMFGIVLLRPPETEHILARTAKNKIGEGEPDFALMVDRAHATMYEIPMPNPDRERGDAFDDVTPRIDLERVIYSLVRDKPCSKPRTVEAFLKEQNVDVRPGQVAHALEMLIARRHVVRDQDGTYRVQPWTD